MKVSKIELPVTTKILMGSGDFLIHWWWAPLLVLILGGFLLVQSLRSVSGRIFFDNLFIRLPLIGPVLKMIYLTRFAENFSTLVSSGIPIGKALEITANIVDNNVYKKAILQSRSDIRRGELISSFMEKSPDLFPAVFSQMVSVGEKTGTLGTSLMHIVDFYYKEIDRSMEKLLSLLEPMIIVVLGVGVGFIMMSVLLPLYQSMSAF